MAQLIANDKNKLFHQQLEYLTNLEYMAIEEQLTDIRSLLRHYFPNQLDS